MCYNSLVMQWRFLFVTTILLAVSGCSLFIKSELEAEDIPLKEGTKYETYANYSEKTPVVKVSFNLKGPWDFSKGPTDVVMKSIIIKKSKASDAKQFPKAKVAERVLASSLTAGFTVYNFTSLTDEALLLYGQSSSPKVPDFKARTYDRPERLLKFPLKVGTRWRDTFQVAGDPPTTVRADKKVVSQNTVILPNYTFRGCFLIQIKRTTTRPIDGEEAKSKQIIYVWWAPEVGPVAWIIGEPNGVKETFKQADYFFRLKSYEVP